MTVNNLLEVSRSILASLGSVLLKSLKFDILTFPGLKYRLFSPLVVCFDYRLQSIMFEGSSIIQIPWLMMSTIEVVVNATRQKFCVASLPMKLQRK